jgi:hypothetical protein
MKFSKISDILLNVILPIAIGSYCYASPHLFSFFKNHLADACWAYSFASLVLIIWQRKMNAFWLTAAFLSSILFEVLQYLEIAPGTGDIYDIMAYLFSFLLTIILNQFFNYLFYEEQIFSAEQK